MAFRTLPLLYLNLGGEMMYVLDQRLVAQQVPQAKSAKVLDDIAGTMFNRKFLEEIFLRHQPLHNRRVLRAMFDKLANASIMRLGPNSMEKLYDLMVMAVKHQILGCRDPHDVVGVTLNHLDAVADYATSDAVKANIHFAYELLIQSYCPLRTSEMQSIRHALLNFLQDYRVRVSVFLQEGKQHQDGRFVFSPPTKLTRGVEQPGRIRFFDSHGEVLHQGEFHPGLPQGTATYQAAEAKGSVAPKDVGNRGTKLGLNMYANCSVPAATVGPPGSSAAKADDDKEKIQRGAIAAAAPTAQSQPGGYDVLGTGEEFRMEERSSRQQQLAKEELNLLAKLLGGGGGAAGGGAPGGGGAFKLSVFDDHRLGGGASEKSSSKTSSEQKGEATANTLQIDLKSSSGDRRKKGDELSSIIGEMDRATMAGEQEEEEDLLALMDQAQK